MTLLNLTRDISLFFFKEIDMKIKKNKIAIYGALPFFKFDMPYWGPATLDVGPSWVEGDWVQWCSKTGVERCQGTPNV